MANLQLIKAFAEQRKMPLNELARRCEISEQQIHLMCRTNSTKITTLERIAQELQVPVTAFFEENFCVSSLRQAGRDYAENGVINNNFGDPVLAERIRSLETLLDEKDQRIAELKERISELKK